MAVPIMQMVGSSVISEEEVAVRDTIMQAHRAIMWDANSENKKDLTAEQKVFAKAFRNRRNRELRTKHNCTPILFSDWRFRDTDDAKWELMKKQVEAWNQEMRDRGLISLMYCVEIWGPKDTFQSFKDLEMATLLGWTEQMMENLDKDVGNKYFRRQTARKYEQNITFLRDILNNDFDHANARWSEAVQNMEAIDEKFATASSFIEATEEAIKAKQR